MLSQNIQLYKISYRGIKKIITHANYKLYIPMNLRKKRGKITEPAIPNINIIPQFLKQIRKEHREILKNILHNLHNTLNFSFTFPLKK
jgi:dephospho-CoA kinase